jgi:hypothetical protein
LYDKPNSSKVQIFAVYKIEEVYRRQESPGKALLRCPFPLKAPYFPEFSKLWIVIWADVLHIVRFN